MSINQNGVSVLAEGEPASVMDDILGDTENPVGVGWLQHKSFT